MTIHVVLCSMAMAVSLCLTGLFLILPRSPAWRHYRRFSVVTSITALYALGMLAQASSVAGGPFASLGAHSSLAVGLILPVLWLRVVRSTERRPWSRRDRVATTALLAFAPLALVPNVLFTGHQVIDAHWRELRYLAPQFTALGKGVVFYLLVVVAGIVIHYARRIRRGERGAVWHFASAFLLFVGGALDVFTVAGVISAPLFGCAFLALGALVIAADVSKRIGQSATQIALLNDQLEERIADKTDDFIEAKEALMAAEVHSAMGHLAAAVGHEINNPLTYVTANLEYVRNALEHDDDAAGEDAAIRDALDGAMRIRRIVEDVAEYALTGAGATEADLGRALAIATRIVRPQFRFSTIIEPDVDGDCRIAIDESRLIQVLVALLLNAAQASYGISPLPVTTVRGRRCDDEVTIDIVDHGHGMSAAVMRRAFQPMFTTRTGASGTGLGLYVVQGVVRAAKGTIEIESQQGEGTTVHLSLPAITSAAREGGMGQAATSAQLEQEGGDLRA